MEIAVRYQLDDGAGLAGEAAPVNHDLHDRHASSGSVTGASRFLIGLVTCFATHNGIPVVARAA
jgi:hypothetical protein